MSTRNLMLVLLALVLYLQRHELQRLLFQAGSATLGEQNPIDPPGGPHDPTFGVENPYSGDPMFEPYDPLSGYWVSA